MTRQRRTYWIVTGLLAAFAMLAGIPDLLSVPQAVELFQRLGYPLYLLPFLGVAKLLGVAGILAPGFPRVREWAYAGLAIDFTGAVYSHLSIGDPFSQWWGPVLGLGLLAASYGLYHHDSTAPGTVAEAI
jgi:hypothetical protein